MVNNYEDIVLTDVYKTGSWVVNPEITNDSGTGNILRY